MTDGEIVLASTTDTQEEVNAAVGVVEEPKPAGQQQPKPEENGQGGKPAGERPSKFERKIGKLTARAKTAEEERDRLQRRVDELTAGKEPAGEKKPEPKPEEKKKPEAKDYATYEEYVEALADHIAETKFEKLMQKQRETVQRRTVEERTRATYEAYNAEADKFREEHPDFDEVLGQSVDIPQAAQVAIIALENGPAVAYHLGKHPELCAELMELLDDPMAVTLEVARIAMEIRRDAGRARQAGAPSGAAPEPTAIVPKPPKPKQPVPIAPEAGGKTGTTVPLDELPYDEYKRQRRLGRG